MTNIKKTKTLTGKSLSPGYGQGTAYVYQPYGEVRTFFRKIDPEIVDEEINRFEKAIQNSMEELKHLRQRVKTEIGDSESGIFTAHLVLLKDPQFVSKVKHRIEKDLVNVEHALASEIEEMEHLLLRLQNEYLRQRNEDIRDVGNRILKHLKYPEGTGGSHLSNLPSHTVIIATELLPSDTIQLDRKKISAIVSERGGAQSHAAILARNLGVPYVVGIQGITNKIHSGDWVQVDALNGKVTVSPSAESRKKFSSNKHYYDDILLDQIRDEHYECMTKDGVKIDLYANIGRLSEIKEVKQHYLQGVGLFRTEYLFLNNTTTPDLSTHCKVYRQAAVQLEGLPLVIRTLDLGGDKHPYFLTKIAEDNPNLGLRGLRFSLNEQKMFKTQVKAVLRAAKYGDIRLMFPMVVGTEDLQRAIDFIHQIARNEKTNNLPKLGAMIETPSAVFEIEEILDLVDFVSIGTNDLTQFMLATDRNAILMLDSFSSFCPAMLRAIEKIVKTANAKKKEVCVCGEIAGEPLAAGLLAGMGVTQLSMSPVRAARVRYHLREQNFKDLRKLRDKVLKAKSGWEIRNILGKKIT